MSKDARAANLLNYPVLAVDSLKCVLFSDWLTFLNTTQQSDSRSLETLATLETWGDMTWSKELLPKLYKTRLKIHPKIKLKIMQIVTRAMGGWPDPPGRPGWPDWPDKYSHQIEYERGGVRSVKHANLLIFSFDQSARHIQSSVQEMLAQLKNIKRAMLDTFEWNDMIHTWHHPAPPRLN